MIESDQKISDDSYHRLQIKVTGMSCSSCVAKIERTLGKKPGEQACVCVSVMEGVMRLKWLRRSLCVRGTAG